MTVTDLLNSAEELFLRVSPYLNTIIIALVIIFFGFVIGKIVELLLRRIFARLEVDERFTKLFGVRRNYSRAIRRTLVRLIYLVTIILALRQAMLLDLMVVLVLCAAVLVIIASIILAGVDVLPNILAVGTLKKRRVSLGDEIVLSGKYGSIQGVIVDMNFLEVRVRRRNGDVFFIPNTIFLKDSMVKKRK